MALVLLAVVVALGFGYTAASIAESKGRPFARFFLLGFLLPVFGVVVAALSAAADQGAGGTGSEP